MIRMRLPSRIAVAALCSGAVDALRRGIALPLLEESLERALDLATAMESRGYGCHGKTSKYRAQKFQLVDVAMITSVLYLLVLSPILIAQFTFGLLLAATVLIVALPIVIVPR